MKKLTKLIACLGLALAIAGCSSGSKVSDDALDQFEKSLNKFSEMKSFDYELNLSEDTQKTNIKVYGGVSQKSGIELALAADMKADTQNVEKMIELYLKNKTMYFSFLGQKQKHVLSDSDLDTPVTSGEPFKLDREDMKKDLEEASLSGNKLTLKFNTDKVNDAMKSATSTQASMMSSTIDSISSLVLVITVEDDFMTSATLTVEGKKDSDTIKINADVKINNINKDNPITFPSDLDTYTEGTGSGFPGL